MTAFVLPTNFIDNPESLLRKVQPHVVPLSVTLPATEPVIPTPSAPNTMAEKTLREFSVPAVTNVPVGPNINVDDVNFEVKSGLITMVHARHFVDYLVRTLLTVVSTRHKPSI